MLKTSPNILYDIIKPSNCILLPSELANLLQITLLVCCFNLLIDLISILSNNKGLYIKVNDIAEPLEVVL